MSSRSLNKVELIGNLTRDPELRYTPKGTPVCTFGLATNRSWQPSVGGERQEETEFHRIVAWNKLAELCAELLFKGRKVYVEGRLQTRNWTSADGQERQTVEIVTDNMIVLDSKHREGGQQAGTGYNQDYDSQPAAEILPEQPEAEESADERPVEVVTDEEPNADTKKGKVAKKTTKKSPGKAVAKKTGKSSLTKDEKVNPDDIPF